MRRCNRAQTGTGLSWLTFEHLRDAASALAVADCRFFSLGRCVTPVSGGRDMQFSRFGSSLAGRVQLAWRGGQQYHAEQDHQHREYFAAADGFATEPDTECYCNDRIHVRVAGCQRR